MKTTYLLLCLATLAFAGGCDEKPVQTAPAPREITEDATGHYCGMLLAEHGGPKGQIFLTSHKDPVWFSSVHDTIAFTLLPEEPKDITAIYVTDIGRITNWEAPEPGTWIDAKKAWFVIESRRTGGMGGAELVPFGEESGARDFAAREGGRVIRFDEIPRDYVLAEGPGLRGSGAPAHETHPAPPVPASPPAKKPHQH